VPVPEVIHIARESRNRTETIGTYRDGQFYAAIHGAHLDDDPEPDPQRERVRWYVYLHLFDHAGHHQQSDIWLAGIAPFLAGDIREQAHARLIDLLKQLDGKLYRDIRIRPFRQQYDGITFGLIDESSPDRGDWVELYPDRLGFSTPWDGTYST
jgi:hypothetical protein